MVFADDLKRMVTSGMLSVGGMLEAVGNMSGRKFRELWSLERITSELPALIRQGAQRAPSLVATKTKPHGAFDFLVTDKLRAGWLPFWALGSIVAVKKQHVAGWLVGARSTAGRLTFCCTRLFPSHRESAAYQ